MQFLWASLQAQFQNGGMRLLFCTCSRVRLSLCVIGDFPFPIADQKHIFFFQGENAA